MIRPVLSQRLDDRAPAQARLILPFESRQKSRLLAALDDGSEVGVVLPRGTVLRGGDRLASEQGLTVEIVAAAEMVSIVTARDPRDLARAAYHLGNRHVAVQVTRDSLRYLHDHVLDGMVRGLGLAVRCATLPFEPEAGAYSAAHAQDRHSHEHDHDHAHG